jgi:diguanylate cyclase (GGDEF)-like protein
LQEALERELSRAERKHSEIGIILLDIDHFKQVNDQFGHDCGDVVLRTVGELLQKGVRIGDVVCRFGGEEFVLMLAEASREATWKRAEQLRKTIGNSQIRYDDHVIGPVTISAGVSIFPHDGTRPDQLIRTADEALYEAKNNGRNRVVLHSFKEVIA